MTTPITVTAPPSKSLSHRALIAAALADGVSVLRNVLESDDTGRTLDVLGACGASALRTAPGEYRIRGLAGVIAGGDSAPLSCFVGESGTSCRLLTAVLAAGRGLFRIHGAKRIHERPVGDLARALTALGAEIRFEETKGCPPLVLRAQGLRGGGGWVPVSCDLSSQFLSGLLLAAPLAAGGLNLLLAGQRAVSWPYVGLTLQTLEDFGIAFGVETRAAGGAWQTARWRTLRAAEPGGVRFTVPRGRYRPFSGRVEGDYSGASYLLAAGALGPNPVTVAGLRRDSLQGDAAIVDIVRDMGAAVAWDADAVTVSPPPGGRLRGIDRDMGGCPDLVPTLAVLASRAAGESRIRGAAHLRLKESDRLAAPALELAKTGCGVAVTDDGLHIVPARAADPARATKISFSCHNDHRMAMSLALLELGGRIRVSLDEPACVGKSFPDFWRVWRRICPNGTAGGGL